MIWLFVLFTVVPALELYLLLQLGAWLGATETFLIIVMTGLVGAWLSRREGLGVLVGLQGELQQGLPPTDRLAEAALVMVGGLLLITPGVLTDVTGFLLIVPWTRRFIAPRVVRWFSSRIAVQTLSPLGAEVDVGAGGDPVRIREPRRVPASESAHPFANKFDDLP